MKKKPLKNKKRLKIRKKTKRIKIKKKRKKSLKSKKKSRKLRKRLKTRKKAKRIKITRKIKSPSTSKQLVKLKELTVKKVLSFIFLPFTKFFEQLQEKRRLQKLKNEKLTKRNKTNFEDKKSSFRY